MSVRKTLTAGFAAAVATSAVTLIASPAHAAYNPQPEDSKAAPATADLIGAGSDTTMLSMFEAAKLWNEGAKADYGQTFDVATFGAFGGGEIPLPANGLKNRPNGSSAGKAALLNTADYSDLDFARSSDRIGGTGKEAEGEALEGIPFALDTVVMAVSGLTASHAPTTLTLDQLKAIYTCTTAGDSWADFGGADVPIKPYTPQSGSGTEKFFKAQIGGSYGACVKDYVDTNGNNVQDAGEIDVQEHKDDAVKNDPAAIVPISKGRAGLIPGNTVRLIEGELAFKRVVYNAVRAADVAKPEFQAFFGENGFLCSAAAAEAIAAGGLTQLATPANGGACGIPSDSSSDYDTNQVVSSTTSLTGAAVSTGVQLVAKVTGASQPTGSVSFYEGATLLKGAVPLVSGQATFVVPSPAAGMHTYKAVFKPNNAKFLGSEATVSLNYVKPGAPSGVSQACADTKAKVVALKSKYNKAKKTVKKAKSPAAKKKAKAKLKKAQKKLKKAKVAAKAAC